MLVGSPMAKHLHHPDATQIDLSAVLEALSDPTRRQILRDLAERGEARCSSFQHLGAKTALTYHFARLREAGVTRTRVDGTQRFMSLRRADLDARFPGLLAAVLASSGEAPEKSRRATGRTRAAAATARSSRG
jgi:DNA-binding transcriptional ArsR family regulator